MAISVLKFMQARFGKEFDGVNMYAHHSTLNGNQVQAIREGLKKYADTAAKDYAVLLKYQKDTKSKDADLIATLKNLNGLIKEMQSMDEKGASTAQMNEFFKKYRTTFEGIAPLEGSESDHRRAVSRALKANHDRLKAEQKKMFDALGDRFEEVIAKNSDVLGSAQGSALKVALSGFLGPAAPLVAVVDKMFDIDQAMGTATKKTFQFMKDSFTKKEQERDEDEREADRRQEQQKSWFNTLTEGLLGKDKAHKASGKGFLGKFGTTIMEGVLRPFKMLEKVPGFKMLEKMIGHLGGGLARAAIGVVGGGARVLGKVTGAKYIGKGIMALVKHLPGVGMLGGGAAAEGAAALGGAAVMPVLAGVAAVAAAGFGVYELFQHRKEVKAFLEKTGALKAAKSALDGISKVAGLVVSGVETVWGAVESSGLLTGIERLTGAVGRLLGKGATMAFQGWMDIFNGVFHIIGDLWSGAMASGIPQLIGGFEKFAWTKVFGMLGGIFNWIADLADAITTGHVGDFLGKTWDKVKAGFSSAMSGLAEVFSWIGSNVGPFIVEPLVKIMAATQNSVGGMLKWVGTTLTSGWLGHLVEHIPGAAKMLKGLIQEGASIQGGASAMLARNAAARTAGAKNIRQTAATALSAATPAAASVASAGARAAFGVTGASMSQSKMAGASASGAVYSASRKVGGLLVPDPTIGQIIVNAAKTVGVDPGLMLAIASAESGFHPDAKANSSSASGLYQFTRGTWQQMVAKYGMQYGITSGMEMDPKANALMGALFVRDNAAVLQSAGLPVNAGSLYMAHFMGAGGAVSFMKAMQANPTGSAAAMFPAQARANQSIFYANGQSRSLAQVYDLMTTNPNKVSVAKAQAYDKMIGYTGGGIGSSNSPVLASASTKPSYSRTTPIDVAKASQASAPPTHMQVAAASGGGLPASAPLSVDSVPSTVTDEGMLILTQVGITV